jgi:hypothetical protein
VLTPHQEVSQISVLNFDLATIPLDDLLHFESPGTKVPFYKAVCTCKAVLFQDILTIEVLFGELQLCSVTIAYD